MRLLDSLLINALDRCIGALRWPTGYLRKNAARLDLEQLQQLEATVAKVEALGQKLDEVITAAIADELENLKDLETTDDAGRYLS